MQVKLARAITTSCPIADINTTYQTHNKNTLTASEPAPTPAPAATPPQTAHASSLPLALEPTQRPLL